MEVQQLSKVNAVYPHIYDGTQYLCLEHLPSGQCALFDYDLTIVERLKEEAEKRHKSVSRDSMDHTLYFPKSPITGESSLNLAAFLYAYYKGISIKEVRARRIVHTLDTFLPNGMEDCRSQNLAATSDITPVTSSRKVLRAIDPVTGKELIEITFPLRSFVERFDYDPELYRLLATPNICGFSVNPASHRVMLDNMQNIPVSRLAYAFYHNLLDLDNVHDSLSALATQWNGNERKDRIEAEHQNSDVHNNCRFNLSLMKGSINSAKRDCFAHFQLPYYLYGAVTEDGEHRIKFISPDMTGEHLIAQYFQCSTAEDLKHLLFTLIGRGSAITKGLKFYTSSSDAPTQNVRILTPEETKQAHDVCGTATTQRDFYEDRCKLNGCLP